MANKKDQYTTGDIGAAVYGVSGEPDESLAGETGNKGGAARGSRQQADEPATTPYRLDTNQGDMSTGGAGGTNDPGTGTGDTIDDTGRDGVDTGVSRR